MEVPILIVKQVQIKILTQEEGIKTKIIHQDRSLEIKMATKFMLIKVVVEAK